jgi:hypothetical protein
LLRKYWDKIQEQMWMTHGKCANAIRNVWQSIYME